MVGGSVVFIKPVYLNGSVFIHRLSGCCFESCCYFLNFRKGTCFEQRVI